MLVVSEYPLRDLGGGDPYEHDGDDEDEPSPVLEVGTHAATTRPASPAAAVREEEVAAEASNLTARAWGVGEWSSPARPHACGGLGG